VFLLVAPFGLPLLPTAKRPFLFRPFSSEIIGVLFSFIVIIDLLSVWLQP
jgi:hypothetical protein